MLVLSLAHTDRLLYQLAIRSSSVCICLMRYLQGMCLDHCQIYFEKDRFLADTLMKHSNSICRWALCAKACLESTHMLHLCGQMHMG